MRGLKPGPTQNRRRGLKHDEGKLREDATRRTLQGVRNLSGKEKALIFINEGWKGVNLG